MSFVSFDYDLGGTDTAMAAVAYLERRCFEDESFPLPRSAVHSANPVGGARLRAALAAIARRRAG